jgi:hypothetical protein
MRDKVASHWQVMAVAASPPIVVQHVVHVSPARLELGPWKAVAGNAVRHPSFKSRFQARRGQKIYGHQSSRAHVRKARLRYETTSGVQSSTQCGHAKSTYQIKVESRAISDGRSNLHAWITGRHTGSTLEHGYHWPPWGGAPAGAPWPPCCCCWYINDEYQSAT